MEAPAASTLGIPRVSQKGRCSLCFALSCSEDFRVKWKIFVIFHNHHISRLFLKKVSHRPSECSHACVP